MFLRACPSDNNGSNEGEESSLVIGTYNLTEVNVSNSEGLNKDGVLSINLLDELSCLDGVLINNADGIWNMDLIELNITRVTGNFYGIRCGRSKSYIGKWSFQGDILNLNSIEFDSFNDVESESTENVNEDLPEFLNRKFLKQ